MIITDGELQADELTLAVAELLNQSGPFGQGFPEPVFDGRFKLVNQRMVGQLHLKLILQIPESGHLVDGIAFHVDMNCWPNYRCEEVFIAYRLDINEYLGKRKLQLLIEEIQPVK